MSAELWIIIAFVSFLLLFGRKLWIALSQYLDNYIKEVEDTLNSARKAKSDADIMLREANQKKRDVDVKIAEHKRESDLRIEQLKKDQEETIAHLQKHYEQELERRLQLNLEEYKQRVTERAAAVIRQAVIDSIKEQHIDINNDMLIREMSKHLK